jgi:hypothetical protein
MIILAVHGMKGRQQCLSNASIKAFRDAVLPIGTASRLLRRSVNSAVSTRKVQRGLTAMATIVRE